MQIATYTAFHPVLTDVFQINRGQTVPLSFILPFELEKNVHQINSIGFIGRMPTQSTNGENSMH